MKGRNAIKGIPKSPWNLASITTAPVARRKKRQNQDPIPIL
jgi:hypothetical protein